MKFRYSVKGLHAGTRELKSTKLRRSSSANKKCKKKAIKVSAKMHEYCSDASYKMQNAKILPKKKRIQGARSVVLRFCLKLVN